MTFTTAAFDRSSSWRFEALPTGRLRRVLLHLSYSMALSRLLDTTPPSHPALPSGGPPRHPGRAPRRSRVSPCCRSVPCPLLRLPTRKFGRSDGLVQKVTLECHFEH